MVPTPRCVRLSKYLFDSLDRQDDVLLWVLGQILARRKVEIVVLGETSVFRPEVELDNFSSWTRSAMVNVGIVIAHLGTTTGSSFWPGRYSSV